MVQHLLDQAGQDELSGTILYVQADHFLIRNRNLYEIAQYFVDMGDKTICFDEIHKYPGWSVELKSMSDTFSELKILASGNSALEITQGSHDLSRRALQINMWGMSFREYLELKLGVELPVYGLDAILQDHVRLAHTIVERLEENKVLPHFKSYLRHGCYPCYFEEENNEKSS